MITSLETLVECYCLLNNVSEVVCILRSVYPKEDNAAEDLDVK